MKIKILVVEDTEKHMQDFDTMIKEEKNNVPFEIFVEKATNLEEAMALLKATSFDGVITDLFFPTAKDREEEGNGKIVAEHCLNHGIPFVIITSTYHHSSSTQPYCEWGRAHGFELVDADGTGDGHKSWKAALYGLFFLYANVEAGLYFIEERGIFTLHLFDEKIPNEEKSEAFPRGYKAEQIIRELNWYKKYEGRAPARFIPHHAHRHSEVTSWRDYFFQQFIQKK